jgi:hypothetical protein
MIGTRHVTTSALALGAILLATTALPGAYAQARGEGVPSSIDSRVNLNPTDPDDPADLDAAEPIGSSQRGPFVPGSNPDGGGRARFTGQPSPGTPAPKSGALPPNTARQPTQYAAQRYSGGAPSPTIASKQPGPSAPGGYPSPGTQGGAKSAPYKQQPYGIYADTNGYQDGYSYRGGYGGAYQGAYGGHQHDCP